MGGGCFLMGEVPLYSPPTLVTLPDLHYQGHSPHFTPYTPNVALTKGTSLTTQRDVCFERGVRLYSVRVCNAHEFRESRDPTLARQALQSQEILQKRI